VALMKPEWRRFAPLGLYLSGLAALVSIGLYIVQREFNLALQISLCITVLGLALFVLFDPEKVRAGLTGRQARYGSNTLLLTLAFIGILVVVNYWVYQIAQRWDLTEDQQNTLATETTDTLQAMPEPVVALAFFSPQRSSDYARQLLDDYKFYGNGNFDYQFIDPISDPIAAQQAQVTRDGTIVLTMADRQEQVTSVNERELTGALVRLLTNKEQVVYFLTGHGEYNPEETGDQSYSQAKLTLESKNYSVKVLNLLATNEIPEDASVVVIAGPLQPVQKSEVDLLKTYVDQGGALIYLAEPAILTQIGDQPDLLAEYFTADWGLILSADIVVDQTSLEPFFVFADHYGDHVITDKLQQVASAFPTARSVQIDSASSASPTGIIFSASQSWAETDFAGLQEGTQPSPDEEQDLIGPITLAAVAEDTNTLGRVAVFGDADFASDAYFTFLGNGDLLINTIDWSVGQEDLINLTPKTPTQRLMMSPQPYVVNLILLGVVFVLPGAVLISGIVVWVQRRRRG
jgi:ABC-type uncharacterized transport system involved in gliding motility auxiliary subunit